LAYLIGLVLAAVVVWIATIFAFGYPAMITGALIGVALAFAWMLGLTSGGLFAGNDSGAH